MTECRLSDSFKDICDEQNVGGGGGVYMTSDFVSVPHSVKFIATVTS